MKLTKWIVARILRTEQERVRAFVRSAIAVAVKAEAFSGEFAGDKKAARIVARIKALSGDISIRQEREFVFLFSDLVALEEQLQALKILVHKNAAASMSISQIGQELRQIKETAGFMRKVWACDWIDSIFVAVVFAIIIRTFVIQPFKIPSGSMWPTLKEGDVLFVNKFLFGARIPFTDKRLPKVRDLKRGDVIVFLYPENPKKAFIKRLVGIPADTVEIRKGTIYINDKPLLEDDFSQRYYYNYGPLAAEDEKITVPKNSYFVLGDNSASSQDSRYWGFVPHRNILGKAVIIWWPPNRIRIIK